MKSLLVLLAIVLTILHPIIVFAVVLGACGVLAVLICRAARGRVYPSSWRSA